MLPLFFFENILNEQVTLDEETSRHIVQVLRMKVGSHVQLTDGKGILAEMKIIDDHKKKCTVEMISRQMMPAVHKEITIAISLLKNSSRFEWFLEKATEIGVSEIVPLICSRTEKQHFRFERMNGIVKSAMLQSHQYYKPRLSHPVKFAEYLEQATHGSKFIAHCINEEQRTHIHDVPVNTSAVILIGPEGDFTPEEIVAAKGFTQVSLGNNRLRTETAGVVAGVFLCR